MLFLLSAILIFLVFDLLSSITGTLNRLDVVEADRDRWQRPAEVPLRLEVKYAPDARIADLLTNCGPCLRLCVLKYHSRLILS